MRVWWILVCVRAASKAQALRAQLNNKERKWISAHEAELWVREAPDDALQRMKRKAEWREEVGAVSMSDCARFFGSDGFTVCLEGLRDKKGQPLVFSYGLPRGNEKQIRCQTVYLQERVMANEGTRPCTVIDTRAPSFRMPDADLRRGGIATINDYYPWANAGTTVFVGVPPILRTAFQLTKPFFPAEFFARFAFVDDFRDLKPDFVDKTNLPMSWGGAAPWSLRAFVPLRCLKEGTLCKPAPRNL